MGGYRSRGHGWRSARSNEETIMIHASDGKHIKKGLVKDGEFNEE